MKIHRAPIVTTLLPLALGLLPAMAMAQSQQPVTGQMMGGQRAVIAAAAPAPVPVATPTPAPAPVAAGDTHAAAPSAYADASTTPLQQHVTMTPPIEPETPVAPYPPRRDAWVAYAEDAPAPYTSPVGETTRDLLRRQAQGSEAGQPLPMLGAEASASYRRYLDSFNHEIPEFFKTTVDKDNQGGR